MVTGFTITGQEGHYEIQSFENGTPGDGPALFYFAQDPISQTAVMILGQLHYRNESRCEDMGRDGQVLSDAEFILRLYLQQGAAGLCSLEGEFSVVVIDRRCRRLIGIRDPFGCWPLYWTTLRGKVAMGTRLHRIGVELNTSTLDLNYVAEFFSLPFIPAEASCRHTALRGVQRVLPGTLTTVHEDGKVESVRYWDWMDRNHTFNETSAEEAATGFMSTLSAAIRERIRGRTIGVHLSGGMDSSTVAVLAARMAPHACSDRTTTSLSLIYKSPELAPEQKYIDLIVKQEPVINAISIRSDKAIGFDWFRQKLPRHDEPYVGLWGVSVNRLLVNAASETGVRTVLTGFGGDEIFSCRPLHISSLLNRGKLIAAVREAANCGRANGEGTWSLLKKCGFAPLMATHCRFRIVRKHCLNNLPSWITPSFAQMMNLGDRISEHRSQQFAFPAEVSETVLRLKMLSGDWSRWYLHAPLGISVTHPFLDRRVVSYVMDIPLEQRNRPGTAKFILGAATKDILPEQIRNRTEKTGFNGPHCRGLNRYRTALEKLIRRSALRELKIFDEQRLIAALDRISVGCSDSHCEAFDRILAMIAWYDASCRQFAN